MHHILGIYGLYIIERSESELDQTIFSSSSVHSRSPLALYRHNIHMVEQTVRNDVSSTKVRLFIRKGMSVKYLIPTVVIRYITRHGLYRTADRRRSSLAQVAPGASSPALAGPSGTSTPTPAPPAASSAAAAAPPPAPAPASASAAAAPSDAHPQHAEAERERAKGREDERGRRDAASSSPSGGGGGTGPGAVEDAEMACA